MKKIKIKKGLIVKSEDHGTLEIIKYTPRTQKVVVVTKKGEELEPMSVSDFKSLIVEDNYEAKYRMGNGELIDVTLSENGNYVYTSVSGDKELSEEKMRELVEGEFFVLVK